MGKSSKQPKKPVPDTPPERSLLQQSLFPMKATAKHRPPPRPRVERPSLRGFALLVRSCMVLDGGWHLVNFYVFALWCRRVIGLAVGFGVGHILAISVVAFMSTLERWVSGWGVFVQWLISFFAFWIVHGWDTILAHVLDSIPGRVLRISTFGTCLPAAREWIFLDGSWKAMTNTPKMVPAVSIFSVAFLALGSSIITPAFLVGLCVQHMLWATVAYNTVASDAPADPEEQVYHWIEWRGSVAHLRAGMAVAIARAAYSLTRA